MTPGRLFAVVAVAGILAGCQAPQQNAAMPAPTPADLTAMKQKWEGTWSGMWDGTCPSSIEVTEVQPTSAHVVYSYGACGERPPGTEIDPEATISGDTLSVHVALAIADYTMSGPNTLQGRFNYRDRVGEGTFVRE